MAGTIVICESNGAGETITHGISNLNMGDTDAANMTAAFYPIAPSNFTIFHKIVKFVN